VRCQDGRWAESLGGVSGSAATQPAQAARPDRELGSHPEIPWLPAARRRIVS